ncbi:hypothetical protein ACFQZC_04575 [Streptacidiphilus monticola]
MLTAYWDGGLAHLVVQLTEDAVSDRVVDRVDALAAEHGLTARPEPESRHPGGVAEVRVQAVGLACDALGLGVALGSKAVRLERSPRLLAAAGGLLREDPRVERVLRRRLGGQATDLLLAGLGAAAQGLGGSPTGLALDGALRATRLAGAVARAAAFATAHDRLCGPGRSGPDTADHRRPRCGPGPRTTTAARPYWVRASARSARCSSAATGPRPRRRCRRAAPAPPGSARRRSPPSSAERWPPKGSWYAMRSGCGAWRWSTRWCCMPRHCTADAGPFSRPTPACRTGTRHGSGRLPSSPCNRRTGTPC